MTMIDFFLFIFTLSSVGAFFAYTCSRTSKLARLAKNYGCNFERQKSSVTTATSAGKLEWLTRFFHQFNNIFTFATRTSFIRMADDSVFLDDKPKTKPLQFKLFSAEMRKIQFPILKIVSAASPFAASQYTPLKTTIAPIDNFYKIYGQSNHPLLTPFILNLLKENQNLYLEVNDTAFIYHEHALIEPQKIEEFRFRATKILNEFEAVLSHLAAQTAPEKTEQTPAAPVDIQDDPALQRAEAMLQSFASVHTPATQSPNQNLRIFWFILVLLLFFGISIFSWFVLHNWVGR